MLQKQISYLFVGQGSTATGDSQDPRLMPKNNRLFLDVGNALNFEKGIIDNHQVDGSQKINRCIGKSITSICIENENKIKDFLSLCNDDKIEIVVHLDPDLDCYASAFVIGEFLKGNTVNETLRALGALVDVIDAGQFSMNLADHSTKCLVSNVFDDVLLRNGAQKEELNEKIMSRGIELINSIINIWDGKQGAEEHFFQAFQEEWDILKKDYTVYTKERDEKCEKHKIRLPRTDGQENQLVEVDALFWNNIPETKYHKYWARGDQNSPSGHGYVMTFIPKLVEKKAVDHINENFKEADRYSDSRFYENIFINQVIISTDPNVNVNLYGLGKIIETAEQRVEKAFFGEKTSKWRSRERARFIESWCDNEDPWYDGRAFNHTIVDSPSIGSLLSMDELKHITLNYPVPLVTACSLRYVVPFEFRKAKFNKLVKGCKALPKVMTEPAVKEHFNEYIKRYLFDEKQDKKSNCYSYRLQQSIIQQIEDVLRRDNPKYVISVLNDNLRMFKYGTGVVLFDIELKRADGVPLRLNDVLSLNSKFSKNMVLQERLKKIFDHHKQPIVENIKFMKPLLYAGLTIRATSDSNSMIQEVIHKLMNFVSWDDAGYSARYFKNINEHDIVQPDDNTYFGFSKNGGVMMVIDDCYYCQQIGACVHCNRNLQAQSKCAEKRKYYNLNSHYFMYDSYIFLLALHQRMSLLYFSNKLAEMDKRRKKRQIERLRQQFMSFTAQGWFAEITEDKIGTELYRRWLNVFESQQLFDEVHNQLSSIDDFYRAKQSSKFTFLSMITFPVLIFAAIVGVLTDTLSSGILGTKKDIFAIVIQQHSININWGWFELLLIILLIVIGAIVYKKE